MTASLERHDMNEWWNEMDHEKELSQSSMSLSHTLPSTQGLQLANHSTANSDISKPPRPSNLTPIPRQSMTSLTRDNSINSNHDAQNTQNEQNMSSRNFDHNEESKHNNEFKEDMSTSPSSNVAKNIPVHKIIYDDKHFTKFNKTYKFKKCNQNTNIHSHANVYRITNRKNPDLCVKETTVSNNDDLKRCVNELKSLTRLYAVYYKESGFNISEMVCLYVNKKKGSTNYPKKARLVMKYHPGEDLDDFLVDEEDGEVGFLFPEDFRAIMKKILIQLSICHAQGILHCDLKPNNIRFVFALYGSSKLAYNFSCFC